MTIHAVNARDPGGPIGLTATAGVGSTVQLSLLRAVSGVSGILGRDAGARWTRRGTAAISDVFDARNTVRCTIFDTRQVEVSMADRYWMPYLLAGAPYEPDMLQVLRTLLRPESTFIDCGANVGWWSIFASTVIGDPVRILALEPARLAYLSLDRNRGLNDGRFECQRVAVSDVDLASVELGTAVNRPASSALIGHDTADGRFSATEQVRSCRLDSIIEERFGRGVDRIVLKLDVEGAEIRALRGAGRYLNRLAAVVYEDHGQDVSCSVSRELISSGFVIFAPDLTTGIRRMESIARIAEQKQVAGRGYNFVAALPGSEAHTVLQKTVPAS